MNSSIVDVLTHLTPNTFLIFQLIEFHWRKLNKLLNIRQNILRNIFITRHLNIFKYHAKHKLRQTLVYMVLICNEQFLMLLFEILSFVTTPLVLTTLFRHGNLCIARHRCSVQLTSLLVLSTFLKLIFPLIWVFLLTLFAVLKIIFSSFDILSTANLKLKFLLKHTCKHS